MIPYQKIAMIIAALPVINKLATLFRDFLFRKQVAQVVAWTSPKNKQKVEDFLEHSFPYYKLLKPAEKEEFVNRLQMLLQYRFFEARNGLELTDEIIFAYCAVWVQITFGLNKYLSPEYDRIIMVPDEMVSRTGNTYLYTLNNKIATVQISWKPFMKGYLNSADKRNPGIDVCARLLLRDYFMINQIERNYDAWTKYATVNHEEIDAVRQQLFEADEFAGVEDLWAACCVALFEAPLEFEQSLPELYRLTATVLNQHMAARLYKAPAINS